MGGFTTDLSWDAFARLMMLIEGQKLTLHTITPLLPLIQPPVTKLEKQIQQD